MAADNLSQGSLGGRSSSGPATRLRAVTPHDTNELPFVSNGIIAGGAGNVAIVALEDTNPVIVPILAGQLLPIRARLIRATGTTATGIVALIS